MAASCKIPFRRQLPVVRGEKNEREPRKRLLAVFVKILLHCPAVFDRRNAVAEVVELVDTLGSGSSDRTVMRVRVSPSAPSKKESP